MREMGRRQFFSPARPERVEGPVLKILRRRAQVGPSIRSGQAETEGQVPTGQETPMGKA